MTPCNLVVKQGSSTKRTVLSCGVKIWWRLLSEKNLMVVDGHNGDDDDAVNDLCTTMLILNMKALQGCGGKVDSYFLVHGA